jgi:hypothetical protein
MADGYIRPLDKTHYTIVSMFLRANKNQNGGGLYFFALIVFRKILKLDFWDLAFSYYGWRCSFSRLATGHFRSYLHQFGINPRL